MVLALIPFALTTMLAQVPQARPALDAARDARGKTEAAQQKNADALAPAPPQSEQKPPPPGSAATPPPDKTVPPPPQGAGYTYDPAGRRDPFVSLAGRGGDVAPSAGARPPGVPGLLVAEVTVKGVFQSRGGRIALVQSPDSRTYIIKAGDKVFDGSVRTITQDAVVFSQDVNDPLSLVKQREVRKAIRPEAR